jgi:NH3-dependent NAD+ synthetase
MLIRNGEVENFYDLTAEEMLQREREIIEYIYADREKRFGDGDDD